MKKLLVVLLLLSNDILAQDKTSIYHPEADAKSEINAAVKKAVAEQKHVLLMIGGNWCKWCKIFDTFQHSNPSVDSAFSAASARAER